MALIESAPPGLARVYWRLVIENRSTALSTLDLVFLLRKYGVAVLENEYSPLLHKRIVHRFNSFAELNTFRLSPFSLHDTVACPRAEKIIDQLITLHVPIDPDIDYPIFLAQTLDRVATMAQ